MTNAELIKALRNHRVCEDADGCKTCELMNAAADALEAADKRIADLEKSYSWKAYAALEESIEGYKTRIAELEAQLPKEGEWKKILQNGDGTSDYECSACLGIIMNVPDDDEHPLCSFCPNCGARMKGANDEH